MTSTEHSSPNPATSEVEVAAVLERNPLLPLTLGVLSTADSMKPSDVQRFIIEAANEQVSEDGDHEPTHDTSEILNACANLQQAGLAMVSQAESEEEPRITLTPTGQTVGLAVAKDIMKNYIDRGHGINKVEHKTPPQGPGVIGMIALGAAGIVGKVAEVIDDGMQEISEEVRNRVRQALRTRPLPKPSFKPVPESSKPTSPVSGKSPRSSRSPGPPSWLGSPPEASPPAATSNKAQPQTETPKFKSKIVQPPLKVSMRGLGVRVPSEYEREAHPRSSLDDRPAKRGNTIDAAPDNPPESTPSDKADQNTPGSENSFKPDTSSSAGSQDPQNGGQTSGGPGSSDPEDNPQGPTGQPAGSSATIPTQKPDSDKEKAPKDQDKPGDKSSKEPETQPKVGGGGHPGGGNKDPRTPTGNAPRGSGGNGGGSAGSGGGPGGGGGSPGSSSSNDGGKESSLEEVRVTLQTAEAKTEEFLGSMRVALDRTIEEKELLEFARQGLETQPLESVNPLEVTPADIAFLALAQNINFGARIARLTKIIEDLKEKLGEGVSLSNAIHNISGRL